MVVTRDPELLIKEARRRTRRRRLVLVGGVAVVVGVVAAATLLATGGVRSRHPAGDRGLTLTSGVGGVRLKRPDALAVAPSGALYVVDPTRDQILRLLPSGRFAVFAGSGRQGLSGDGGSARRAALRLSANSTVAVAGDGTVYVADTGNNRVRTVAANGIIHTLVRVSAPAGLAVGPHDQLYIGASDLFRLPLTPGAKLQRLAGWRNWKPPITRHEILEGYFSPTQGLAVNRAGDVFAVSFPGIFERTASGALRCLGSFRAGGQPAQLTEGPDGDLYAAAFGIFRLDSRALAAAGQCDGGHPLLDERGAQLSLNRSIDAAMSRTPGWRNLARLRPMLIGPANGLAVARDGTIYYDSDFSYWATPALVEITPGRHVRVLWRART